MIKKIKKAVVLLSGGMDSLVTASIANKLYEMAFLHINYGQRTENKELLSFNKISKFYNVKSKLVVNLNLFSVIGGSSLTDNKIPIPKADIANNKIPSSYVPFRNANFLSIAVSWAEVINACSIFIGAVEEDSSGYPDCRKVFYDAFNKVIVKGTKPETNIRIETPIIDLKKHEIVKLGMESNAPFELSWSCYKDNDIACGECDSCALRLKAFKIAGYIDPIEYHIKSDNI